MFKLVLPSSKHNVCLGIWWAGQCRMQCRMVLLDLLTGGADGHWGFTDMEAEVY